MAKNGTGKDLYLVPPKPWKIWFMALYLQTIVYLLTLGVLCWLVAVFFNFSQTLGHVLLLISAILFFVYLPLLRFFVRCPNCRCFIFDFMANKEQFQIAKRILRTHSFHCPNCHAKFSLSQKGIGRPCDKS
jgi:hypothetical protein